MFKSMETWGICLVVVSIGLPLAIKAAKAYINRDFKNILDKSMKLEDIKDPILREKLKKISLDVVDLMEYLIPDRGRGAEKFAKADAALASIPLLSANPGIRKALIEGGCEIMWTADDALKAEVKEHLPPTPQEPTDPPAA
jgi:hypothetical protein